MSLYAWQVYAGAQVPPWQFVEQHSVPAPHASPRVLQTPVVSVEHVPEVVPEQLPVPEQHSVGDVQAAPIDLHIAWPHRPPVELVGSAKQSTVQQSLGRAGLHSEPTSTQKAAVEHAPETHRPEQQGVPFVVQATDLSRQVGPPPVVQVPPTHEPRQQGVGPPTVQVVVAQVGAWQVPPSQTSPAVQHPRPPTVHAASRATHVGGASHVVVPVPWHVFGLQHVVTPAVHAPCSPTQLTGALQSPLWHVLGVQQAVPPVVHP
jgi:hypothetical protein